MTPGSASTRLAEDPDHHDLEEQRAGTDSDGQQPPHERTPISRREDRGCGVVGVEQLRHVADIQQGVDDHQDAGSENGKRGQEVPDVELISEVGRFFPENHLEDGETETEAPEHRRVDRTAGCVEVAQEERSGDDVHQNEPQGAQDEGAVLDEPHQVAHECADVLDRHAIGGKCI